MKAWVKSILSDQPGSQSSSRLLMLVFAVFALIVLSCYIYVMSRSHDVERVRILANALPFIFSGCAALLGIPYSVGKISSSVSDIIASLRKTGKEE